MGVPIEAARQFDQLSSPGPVHALEVDEGAQLAPRRPRDGPAPRLPAVAVDDSGFGDEDDLAARVPDAKAPVRVVPAEEDAIVKGPGHARERGPEQLARPENVEDRPGLLVVEVGHQVAAYRAPLLEDAVERRPAEQRQEERREPARS